MPLRPIKPYTVISAFISFRWILYRCSKNCSNYSKLVVKQITQQSILIRTWYCLPIFIECEISLIVSELAVIELWCNEEESAVPGEDYDFNR